MLVVYIESTEIGKIINGDENILKFMNGKIYKKSWLCKVTRSFQTMEFKVAYPFYTISRDTFPEFIDECVNFIFTLITI